MPALQHQWLLLWIARKMTHDGFIVRRFEGPAPHGGWWNHLQMPFGFRGRRPDALAIHVASGLIAIGEAKSAADVASQHSIAQLRLFGSARQRGTDQLCPLYIAVPRSTAPLLDDVLAQAGLLGAKHIRRLHIPDCLLQAPLHDCA